MINVEGYYRWLRKNPRISAGTAHKYRQAVTKLVRDYGMHPTVKQINYYISKQSLKSCSWTKYGIKHFLYYMRRPKDYELLRDAPLKNPVRNKFFIPRRDRYRIIKRFKSDKYRTVAVLQEVTGARAFEILGLQRSRVVQEKDGVVRLLLKGKRGKNRPVWLKNKYWAWIEPYMNGKHKGFLFLNPGDESLDDDNLRARLATIYRCYLRDFKQAVAATGFSDAATHDFRRSRLNEIKDIRKAQLVAGHASIATTERYLARSEQVIKEVMLDEQ
jgi:integrase